jgi:hypothetical protein
MTRIYTRHRTKSLCNVRLVFFFIYLFPVCFFHVYVCSLRFSFPGDIVYRFMVAIGLDKVPWPGE